MHSDKLRQSGHGLAQRIDRNKGALLLLPLQKTPEAADSLGMSGSTRPPKIGGVYTLPGTNVEIPAQWQTVTTYDLELPAHCPHCCEPIRTLKVLRLTRGRVSFISSLPRVGRAIVCPLCDRIIAADLSGLI
jgi:hypothetical protein